MAGRVPGNAGRATGLTGEAAGRHLPKGASDLLLFASGIGVLDGGRIGAAGEAASGVCRIIRYLLICAISLCLTDSASSELS